uniref:Beta-2-microglobulin n=1 Tax=Callorhinchus milii TaxID=7868 RepID=V9LEZ9_CALMI
MKLFLTAVAALLPLCFGLQTGVPQVKMYTRHAPVEGEKNVLICYVSKFAPPNAEVELMEGERVLPEAEQSDLTFETDWSYFLVKHVAFTPRQGVQYGCKVRHSALDSGQRITTWDMDSY